MNTALVTALESAWPSKPALKAVCVSANREESYAALVAVCRAHGVDEACMRQTVKDVLRCR